MRRLNLASLSQASDLFFNRLLALVNPNSFVEFEINDEPLFLGDAPQADTSTIESSRPLMRKSREFRFKLVVKLMKNSKNECPPDLSANDESPGQERVEVDIANLDEAIRKSGKSKKEIFEAARVETKNYSNWKNGRRAYRKTLALVADELETDTRLLIKGGLPSPENRPVASAKLRKVTGRWIITGADIQAPPHFVYQPKPLGGAIELKQDEQGNIEGEGVDHDKAPLFFKGEFIGLDHLRGKYDVEHPRMSTVSGVLVAKFELCGTKITGFYLGRETGGYGQDFLLAKITLTLDGSRDD